MNGNESQLLPQQSIDYPYDYDPSLNGISGWMVIVVIGRILTALISGYNDIKLIAMLSANNMTDILFNLMLALDLLNTIGLSAVMLVLIFRRNILFRTLFVIQFALSILEAVIINIHVSAAYGVPADPSSYANFAGGIIWTIYLFVSKRVKNTFIYNKIYPTPSPVAEQR